MNYAALLIFLAISAVLLLALIVHIGWINCRFRIWQYPEAILYVAVRDHKTRNDFWHMVVNAILSSAFAVMILIALGKIHP
jgi:hypothetical protein